MAPAVDLQPVALHLEVVGRRPLLQHIVDFTAQKVLGEATLGAYQVMVVALVAQLVPEAAVLQGYPAENARPPPAGPGT